MDNSLQVIRKIRLGKLKHLQIQGFNPFPSFVKKTHKICQVLKNFSKLSEQEKEIFLAGRITGWRAHGGAIFLDLKDSSGKVQLLLKKDKVGEKIFELFQKFFDIGDFIQCRGKLTKTKVGEKTLEVLSFKILTKILRPLPEKWHGLQDIEERYRKRYLDLIFNSEVKEKFELRSKIIKFLREFLEKKEFLEVETPILQPLYGGAQAKPFKTHLNALNMDLYLRISPELYLKRLLIGGFEKIYELGKCFRNEGIDRFHNPDFTILEAYWAYVDYNEMMKLTEEMFTWLLKKIFGKTTLKYEDKEINFKTPWIRIDFLQFFKHNLKIDYEEINREGLIKEAEKLNLKIEKENPKAKIADEIYKKYLLPKIWQPTFIIHHPLGFQPLAKSFEKNPLKLANFQLVIAGTELINGFSELNDPIEQGKRFREQEKLFKKGLEEIQKRDNDFLEALEYGMPPAAGFGLGIDRLIVLLTNSHSLREAILFPTMKEK